MKLNVKAIAIAQGAVAGILFLLCRVVFTLFPDTALASSKYLFHTDWSTIATPVNWGGSVLGLVILMGFTAFVGAAWASIYNWITPESSALASNAESSPTRIAA